MAWSIESASPPRVSPTTMRSGRIRRAFRTRSMIVTAPLPSMLAARDSRRTTWSCTSFSSAASDRGDDSLDHARDVLVADERDVRELQLALALDVRAERPVDHDLGDGVVVQERLDRTESEDLVHDLLEHSLTLDARDDDAFLVDELVEHLLDGRLDRLRVGEVEPRVEVVDDPALQT